MTLAYAFCCVPTAPIRAEPRHSAEQVSQLLFGEQALISDINQHGWARITCEHDGYSGFAKIGQLQQVDMRKYYKPQKYYTIAGAAILNQDVATALPIGSSLPLLTGRQFPWFDFGSFNGKKVILPEQPLSGSEICTLALQLLGTPYIWGGRSSFGIDCSGLSQLAYKLGGVALPRDASQQIHQGEQIGFLEEVLPGDLAFFDNEDGKITHVGILLSSDSILHATDSSGCVVIDSIDSIGIVSRRHRKRTHNLRLIKRMV